MPKVAKNKHEQDLAQMVVKSNRMVQRAVYDLSVQEQKLVMYLISKIKPEDDCFVEYDFSLKDLCAACGISNQGKNYEDFKKAILELQKKSFWIDGDDVDVLYTWFSRVLIYKDDTRVRIKFGEDLQPFLLQLKQNFTCYELEKAVVLKSKYSIRLYEMLKSYSYKGEFVIPVSSLRRRLEIQPDEYTLFNNFKVRVLDKAASEINQFTDLDVSWEPIYRERSVHELRFKIKQKDLLGNTLAEVERKKRLGFDIITKNTEDIERGNV